jgi:hypothetical protein
MDDSSLGETLTNWGEIALFASVDALVAAREVLDDPVYRRVAVGAGALLVGAATLFTYRYNFTPLNRDNT